MPKLIFIQPEFASQSCDLPEGPTKVGRSSQNDLVIRDETVSADHCEILVSWNEVIVREHGSRNGTWVAGRRVIGQLPVNHGQVIRFGRVEARLELAELPVDDAMENTAHFVLEHSTHEDQLTPHLHAVVEPAAANPNAVLDESGTMLLPKSAAADPPQAANKAEPASTPSPPARPKQRWLGWVVAVALAGVVIAIWLWRRFH